MERADVQIGQKVRVTAAAGFYSRNIGKYGVVTSIENVSIENVSIHVAFDDGTRDFGYANDLTLQSDSKPEAATIKEAIANVEAALAVLKALVG